MLNYSVKEVQKFGGYKIRGNLSINRVQIIVWINVYKALSESSQSFKKSQPFIIIAIYNWSHNSS